MAKVQVEVRKIRRTRSVDVRRVILDLSEGEADFLSAILGRIGGSLTDSPRKYASRISSALRKSMGYDWERTDAHPLQSGSIYCKNYPDPSGAPRRLP